MHRSAMLTDVLLPAQQKVMTRSWNSATAFFKGPPLMSWVKALRVEGQGSGSKGVIMWMVHRVRVFTSSDVYKGTNC